MYHQLGQQMQQVDNVASRVGCQVLTPLSDRRHAKQTKTDVPTPGMSHCLTLRGLLQLSAQSDVDRTSDKGAGRGGVISCMAVQEGFVGQ